MELATISEIGGDLGQNMTIIIFMLSFASGVLLVGDLHFNR
nr:MAG TPA: hypothetical protein [Inoviridae sp.]